MLLPICRTGLGLLALIASACASASVHKPSRGSAQAVSAPQAFVVREIAPSTYELSEGAPWQANMLLADMPNGELLLINAPATEASTEALWSYLRARFGERRVIVINSHFHMDAIGGNAWLLEHGAEVIGSQQTAALVRARGTASRDQAAQDSASDAPAFAARLQATRVAPPRFVFDATHDLELDFGGEKVRVFSPGAAHTPDNVAVFFPQRAVLFAGCMVKGGSSLGFVGDADLKSWPAAITRLKELKAKVVVPGHEQRLDPEQLDHTLRLLAQQPASSSP